MAHAAFSANLQGRWVQDTCVRPKQQVHKARRAAGDADATAVSPRSLLAWAAECLSVQANVAYARKDPAVQAITAKLRTIAAPFLEGDGEDKQQLELLVRTSKGRFQIRSYPDELFEDLFVRIAVISLLSDHGGFETASVREAGEEVAPLGASGVLCITPCLSRRTSMSSPRGDCGLASSISTASSFGTAGSIGAASSASADSDSDNDAHSPTQSGDQLSIRFSCTEERIFFSASEEELPEGEKPEGESQMERILSNFSNYF